MISDGERQEASCPPEEVTQRQEIRVTNGKPGLLKLGKDDVTLGDVTQNGNSATHLGQE